MTADDDGQKTPTAEDFEDIPADELVQQIEHVQVEGMDDRFSKTGVDAGGGENIVFSNSLLSF